MLISGLKGLTVLSPMVTKKYLLQKPNNMLEITCIGLARGRGYTPQYISATRRNQLKCVSLALYLLDSFYSQIIKTVQ